ncbi:hypothetical protein GLOTRDRAFT_123678 [Gloeophyllum trabeum ATCC 11539]|uniref:HECT domain-containing protein n=1 Tax=Gloeophyllum trabeum (strain ATCC 11539 / FP-39264 / Madison 617) TaxID=670483 RepID=S7PPW8_GLOTA|nr:uncharacterized protein GLOTRDRAFT_123678 [Gloeophyllum trabeum ATCC 11539]EPQ49961.1 hypothetical protein GLOTRDRAFT_123678 [Gloeophyllum trabeum ATCC 11539]
MDLSRLSHQEAAQLQGLLGRMLGEAPSQAAQGPMVVSGVPQAQPIPPVPGGGPRVLADMGQEALAGRNLGSAPAITPYRTLQHPIPSPSLPTTFGSGNTSQSIHSALGGPNTATPLGPMAPTAGSGIPRVMPSISQPFLGLQNLGRDISSQVNRERLSSASATIPRQPALQPRRQRRGRGPAVPPPSLQPVTPRNMTGCLMTPYGDNAIPNSFIRITVEVRPPLEDPSDDIILFRFRHTSFISRLEDYGLIRRYEVPVDLTVVNLIQQVSSDLQHSGFQYQFVRPVMSSTFEHENLDLQLLSYVNRGQPRHSDRQIRLQHAPLMPQVTIANLMSDRLNYANTGLSLDHDRFVIRLVVANYPISGIFSGRSQGPVVLRRHQCLSRRIYAEFRRDGLTVEANEEEGEETASSGGESDGERAMHAVRAEDPAGLGADVNDENIQPSEMLVPTQRTTRATSATRDVRVLLPSVDANDQIAMRMSAYFPKALWYRPWEPATGVFQTPLFDMTDLPHGVFQAASDGEIVGKFELHGSDVARLTMLFMDTVRVALDRKDFTELLAPQRAFYILEGDGTTRSLGDGVEREIISTAFERYKVSSAKWFSPRMDGFYSLATSQTLLSCNTIPSIRLRQQEELGALCALTFVYGMAPEPLDPCLFQYLLNDRDLEALQETYVEQWHPALHQLLKEWQAIGPGRDISQFETHFALYHDVQTAAMGERDDAAHDAIAVDILYRAIMGPEPPFHPEFEAFCAGFYLPCRNGFTLRKFANAFEGGSEAFIDIVYSSRIASSSTLQDRLTILPPFHGFTDELSALCGYEISDILTHFLSGIGVPCPERFEVAKAHFNPIVDLRNLASPTFRPRAFCWAATGSPTLDTNGSKIKISVVTDDDVNYAQGNQDWMAREGKISFRTCFRQVRMPASYIIQLATAVYDGTTEPRDFMSAIEDWLLTETLNAIGGHSFM